MMLSERRGVLIAMVAFALIGTSAGAELPLSSDENGTVRFRTPDGTLLAISSGGEVSIDGRTLIDCRRQPRGEIETRGGSAECHTVTIEVEDRFGNWLEVGSVTAEAEDTRGNAYRIRLAQEVRVDLSDGVRVETGGETVVVGAGGGGAVEVRGAGGSVVVDGGTVSLSGDWRAAGGRYRSVDTERLLVDLGAVVERDHIRLALAGDVLFDFGSQAILPDAADRLAQAAQLIRRRAVGAVHVVGHTDSVGDDASNQRLSEARATAVVGWLSRQEGIPPTVLIARGEGERRPLAHNTRPDGSDDPQGRARNRRVEILLATTEGVDLRTAVVVDAEGVRVGGAHGVEVTDERVRVGGPGGIEVTDDTVRVGGLVVHTGQAGTVVTGGSARTIAGASRCETGETCSHACLEGDCRMTCESGAACSFSCPGGDCVMRCDAGANCDFSCTGGDCHFDCSDGSRCRTSCLGDDCSRS